MHKGFFFSVVSNEDLSRALRQEKYMLRFLTLLNYVVLRHVLNSLNIFNDKVNDIM